MYDLIQALALIAYVIMFTFYGRHYKIPRLKSFLMGLFTIIVYLLLVKFLAWAETGFKSFGSENAIRVYVCIPVLMFLFAKVVKEDVLHVFDLIGISSILVYGIGHLACIFPGCCHGFAYHEGTFMYRVSYALTGTNMLPLQLMESVSALLIFIILYVTAYKMQYKTKGRIFCLWYWLFGGSRFFWEFLRDNRKVIVFAPLKQADGYFGLSTLALWAAGMAITGVIFYFFVVRRYEKQKCEME